MNLDRCLLFSWLEEDNIQKAYFRVRPLLTVEGDVRAEAEQLWPNEGCLRIVPDRNEQHTFKVRMRTLGSFCVVDLRGQPADAGKIRTNKNFRPDKGEVNQYILYSDTVYALPENTFYQIIEGAADDYASACANAVTPLFYIREGDTLYGPVRKESPAKPEPAAEAAGMLFEVPCPDGVTRAILCMEDEPAREAAPEKPAEPAAAAPAPQPEEPAAQEQPVPAPQDEPKAEEPAPAQAEAALPIGESLQILDETKGFEETIRTLDKPLSKDANLLHQPLAAEKPLAPAPVKPGELNGTPLIRTPLRTAVPQAKNRVQEVVSSQLAVGKYEPPAQNLPAGMTMRSVANPVETACASLRKAWNATDAHDQLLDCILSLDGLRGKLEPRLLGGASTTIMQHVLQGRLDDLEAERLTALCELDRAHRDLDAYKEELISGMKGRLNRETAKLESDRDACRNQVDALKKEIAALTDQRDALISRVDELQQSQGPAAIAKLFADAQMYLPMQGSPLRMAPIAGSDASVEEMISRLMMACEASGLPISRNHAIAALTLLALCRRVGIATPTAAPLATLMGNIMDAFGWRSGYAHQVSADQRPVVAASPALGTPAVLMTSIPNYAAIPGMSKVTFGRNVPALIRNAAYDACQWPVIALPALPYVPECQTQGAPVSADSLKAMLAETGAKDEDIGAVLNPILKAALPLSGAARKEMYRFIAACADRMEGGLPVAVDWAILLWIVPALERGSRSYQAVRALLDEYPLSLAAL